MDVFRDDEEDDEKDDEDMISKTSIGCTALLFVSALAACGDDDGSTPMVDAMVGDDTPDAALAQVCFDEAAFFAEAALSNTFDTDPDLEDPLAVAPSFKPADGAPVLTGGGTPPDDGFFDASATFIGAIGADDWTAGWTAYPVDTAGPSGDTVEDVAGGDISADTTWSADTTYILKGKVFVTGGATLTIEPGTLIRGDVGSALVVATDGSIDAQGTADAPIVFTSSKDTQAEKGDWGGVVLIGQAPINVDGGTDRVEGFESGEEGKVTYGGDAADGSCGTLRYVRIEYAGFALLPDNELNGLTVAGCGSGTELDFIQVHRGQDDGIEFFGGRAGIKHAIVSLPDDDGIDWDYGWQGKGQFLIVKQDANNGDKGFESDNNGDAPDATPVSSPELWNMTLIGSNDPGAVKDQGGMHLRRGTAGSMHNAIVAYFKSFAVDVDGKGSVENAEAGELSIENSYFYGNGGDTNWPADFDVADGEENDCVPAT